MSLQVLSYIATHHNEQKSIEAKNMQNVTQKVSKQGRDDSIKADEGNAQFLHLLYTKVGSMIKSW